MKNINNVLKKIDEIYSKIHNDIKFSVAPNFIELSPSADDFIQFATEIWRIEQRIEKLQTTLSENQIKGLRNSLQKFKRYFEKYDMEVVDYTGQKYTEGMNLDVLAFEKDPQITKTIVKATMEPTIMLKGQVVRKAKIIVLN